MEPSPWEEFRVTLFIADASVVRGEDIDEGRKRYSWCFVSNARIISARLDKALAQNYKEDTNGEVNNQMHVSWESTELPISNENLYINHTVYVSLETSSTSHQFQIVLELDTGPLERSAEENELASDEDIDETEENKPLYSPPCLCLLPSSDTQSISFCTLESRRSFEQSWSRIFHYWSPNDASHETSNCVFPHQMSFYKPETAYSKHIGGCVYDFGKERFGNIKITNASLTGPELKPGMAIKLYVGETLAEVMNNNEDDFEQCTSIAYHEEDGYSALDLMCPAFQRIFTSHLDFQDDGKRTYYISEHPLAFRYARVVIEGDVSFHCQPEVECCIRSPRISINGNFSSQGPTCEYHLDRDIWQTAAHTLQSCTYQNFIVDGIKRDRLPWAGDLAVSIMSSAYSFADVESIRCTLTVLGSCGIDRLQKLIEHNANIEQQRELVKESHINGIVDFSLWYFISHWLYQRYFGDAGFLIQEWAKIKLRLLALIKYCIEADTGYLATGDNDWVFIDWSSSAHKPTALQILWWWALDSGVMLGDTVSKIDMNSNTNETKDFSNTIRDVQSRLESHFLNMEDNIQASYSRHGHILGVLSGLNARLVDKASGNEWWSPNTSDEYWQALLKVRKLDSQSRQSLLMGELDQVGTPFMKHLECLALCRLDMRSAALEKVRKYWGGMLSTGATSFYEAFEDNENDDNANNIAIAKFYDRPFARSLCHAWGSGPCALIPEILLGIRPLADDWSMFLCDPLKEYPCYYFCCTKHGGTSVPAAHERLPEVCCLIQTKHGTIEVKLNVDDLRVFVPNGTKMLLMEKVYEPGTHTIPRSKLLSLESVRKWSQKYRNGVHHSKHVIPSNPEISGYEDIEMTDVPTIYQLPGNTRTYYMSFVGFNGTCYQSFTAESTDLVSWSGIRLAMAAEGVDQGGVVLGAYLYESYSINAPRVLKQLNGKFYSLYGAYSKKGGYEIDPGHQGLASSEDGLFWTREEDDSILSIFGPDIVGEWEKSSIYQPWLVEHDGSYYNFYNAKQMPQWVEQIGLATSADLHSWTRHQENPILRVSIDGFDNQFCADAKVFFDYEVQHWVMFYFGVGKGGAHIMIAYSKDLIHWVRDPEPLYYAGGNPSGLDKSYAHKISIIYANSKYYLYYCAVGDDGRGIGLITINPDDDKN